MTDAPVLLSCEQCKRRKTKCDKTFPRCSACKAANINCHPVQRSRLPRGRTGNVKHKSLALADKVARLESLVGRIEAQIQDNENAQTSVESASVGAETNATRSTNRVEDLLAKDFWVALSKEVTGLRETLEGTDGEDSQQPDTGVHRTQSGPQTTSSFLLFNRGPESLKHADTYTNQSIRVTLILQVYYERVDILFKVTHWPTVMKMLQNNDHNNISRSNVASIALEWCICFTAATTLSDQDCEELNFGPKSHLVENCCHFAENFLSQSNFLIEPTFVTIQAFTIYLMGLRTSGQGALTWTLIALVIRLANVLDLGSETNNALSALDIEQRRRVWFAIGLLDSQAAFGRGSVPLLPHTDLKHPPLNINDAEVGIRTVSLHPSTRMTFSCITHQALLCQRRLCDPSTPSFQARAEIVASFESAMRRNHAHLESSDDPLERFTALLAKDVCMNMQLLLRRPPYKSFSSDANKPPSDVPLFDIITTATNVLERGLDKQHDPEVRKWSWFAWPRWYALAIVLVELCSVPIKPSTEMEMDMNRDRDQERDIAINRAHNIAIQSFNNYAQSASDIASGSIWTPIIKLMRRVQLLRGSNLDNHPTSSSTSISPPTLPYLTPETISTNQPQLNDNTILARYCDALSDFKVDTGMQSTLETDPDILWDAFLEDLGDTNMANTSASTSTSTFTPVSTVRPSFGPTNDSTSASAPQSTWSLMPYLPILPQLDSRFNAAAHGQDQVQSQNQTQTQTSTQTGQTRQTRNTNTKDRRVRQAYSVVGPLLMDHDRLFAK